MTSLVAPSIRPCELLDLGQGEARSIKAGTDWILGGPYKKLGKGASRGSFRLGASAIQNCRAGVKRSVQL